MAGSETQNIILDAVQSVIVRDGVQGTSMRQVAQEADVSLGLISYHFDDKERLIFAAFERATDELRSACSNAADAVDAPEEKVRAFLRACFSDEFLNGDYLRLRVSLWAVALTDPEVAKVDTEYYRLYVEALKVLIRSARPDLSPSALNDRCDLLMALTNGLWLDWARLHDDAALENGLAVAEDLALAKA